MKQGEKGRDKLKNIPTQASWYIKDLSKLLNLSTGMRSILEEIVSTVNEDNQIMLNNSSRESISEKLGISTKLIEKTLTEGLKSGIMSRLDRGVYQLDPDLFGFGPWEDIENLELNVQYLEKERKISLKNIVNKV